MRSLIFLVLLQAFLSSAAFAKVDDSADIFFPESLKFLQVSQNEFPVFWWNFLVIEPEKGTPDFLKATEICKELKSQVGSEINRMLCADDLASFVPSLIQWADDQVYRTSVGGVQNSSQSRGTEKTTSNSLVQAQNLKDKLQSALGEIAMLSSVNQDLYKLKRSDPLDQWQQYLEKTQGVSNSQFVRQKGFLLEPQSQRIIIPIQFAARPQMTNILKTEEILHRYQNVILVGAHSSAYINEKQVHEDMQIVSIVGIAVLVLFIGFLVMKGRVSALLLFPPVALALGLSALIVDLVFGSIHGLTLAFGSGIVGLAVDYGLHGAFNAESRQTWKSNSVGFLTTLTGLAVMIMSGIPLIRQMMFFAVLGLFFGFLFFYFLCRFAPKYFTMKSVDLPELNWKFGHYFVIGLIVVGFFSLFKTNLSFDLRKINFQPPQDKKITEWFFTQGGDSENFLLLRPLKELTPKLSDEMVLLEHNKIQVTGLGSYLAASEDLQRENLETWKNVCTPLKKKLDDAETKVFAPFLEKICRENLSPLSFSDLSKRSYASHLVGPSGFITILTSKNPEQATLIRQEFPQAQSLTDSIKGFSNSLQKDLRWMIPVAFLLSTIILFIYYRSFTCVLTAYIPFFTGLGLFFLVNVVRGVELDLISVLGLLMVFGFSLDYGVFATDIYKFPQPGEDESAVYSALGLAAMSNIIGFFPMVFAQHPVLHQLGTALFYGTVGTYIGTIWGIEKLFHWRKLV